MPKTEKEFVTTTTTKQFDTPTGFMLKNLSADFHETVRINPSKHSHGNKELVASAIEDFLMEHWKVFSDGYRDVQSSMLRDYLANEFQMYSWYKNSSQHPFDLYSVEARVAVENKSQKVGKAGGGFGYKNKLVVNATLYPDEAKVRDIVPKKYWKNYDEETLDSFMDVLVVVIDKTKTNSIVRYKVVDGNYWGIDYELFQACTDIFSQINDPEIKNGLWDLLIDKYDNKLARLLRDNTLPGVNLDIRKLFTVENPNMKG